MKKVITALWMAAVLIQPVLLSASPQKDQGGGAAAPTALELWYSPSVTEAGPPPADWKALQIIRDKLNINLTINSLPSNNADYDVKINSAAAANALPDIFQVRREPWYQIVKAGLAAPVDDLYPLMPNRSKLHYTADSRAYTSYNGKSYGLASPGSVGKTEGILIRKDWLDNLKLGIPVTTEDYLAVMRAFTFNDPDGNGRQDTYGLGGYIDLSVTEEGLGRRFDPLMGAFGVPGTWNLTRGDPGLNIRKGAYYDAMVYLKSIVDAKVIDPNWMSYKRDDFRGAWKQGRFGIMRENHSAYASESNYAPFDANFPNGEWIVIDPPKGPQGLQSVGVYVQDFRVLVVSIKASQAGKGPAIAKLLEWMSSDEGYFLLGWGEQGVNYTLDKNGVPTADGLPDPSKGFTKPDGLPLTQLRHLIYYNSEVELLARYPSYVSKSGKNMSALTVLRDMQGRPWTKNIGGDTLPLPNADLKRFYEQGVVEFLTGRRTLTRDAWNAWVGEFDRLGGLDWEKAGIAAAEAGGYLY